AKGFSMDQALPGLDYGNSIFDVRHRFSASAVWQLPWLSGQQGFAGHVLGGWQINGIVSFRGGFPWTPYCSASSSAGGDTSCDFNGDTVRNDRPNAPPSGNSNSNDRSVFEPDHSNNLSPDLFYNNGVVPTDANGNALPCPASPFRGCPNFTGAYNGNLGRNTFRGPNFQEIDLSLFKNIKVSERVNFQFRTEGF